MPSRCSIRNCATRTRLNPEKLSLFKAPAYNQELWEKWESVLRIFNTTLRKSSYVCEKHFLPEEIKRVKVVKENGQVIEKPLNNPRLIPGTVPSIFDWDDSFEINNQTDESLHPECLDDNKGPSLQDQGFQAESDNSRDIELSKVDNDLSRNDGDISYVSNKESSANPVNIIKREKKSILSVNYITTEQGQTINNMFVKEVLNDSEDDNYNAEESTSDDSSDREIDSIEYKVDKNNQKIDIYSLLISKIELPTGWIVTRMNASKEIAFLKISSADEYPFFIERQIVIRKNGELNIQILNKSINISNQDPKTIGDLKNVIDLINDIKICEGGPNKNQYKNLVSDRAHLDQTNKWRHNKCDLIVGNGNTCKYCHKLSIAFERYLENEKNFHEQKVNSLNIISYSTEDQQLESSPT